MKGKYQKFEIEMKRENDRFRLWKTGVDEVVCIMETYKEKRSIFFSVCNLLPSNVMKSEYRKAYHVLLIGVEEGEVIHRDFGDFYVDQRGEGSMFQKFTGQELSCYTHCLLVASAIEAEDLEILYRGETPFYLEERALIWNTMLNQCETSNRTFPFSENKDETKAVWYRISAKDALPDVLEPCKDSIETYQHFILGKNDKKTFVGIPGRFLQREQPCREEKLFLLWQPLRGGEEFFACRETMTERQMEEIFGYWIAELDITRKILLPV